MAAPPSSHPVEATEWDGLDGHPHLEWSGNGREGVQCLKLP